MVACKDSKQVDRELDVIHSMIRDWIKIEWTRNLIKTRYYFERNEEDYPLMLIWLIVPVNPMLRVPVPTGRSSKEGKRDRNILV